MNKEEIDKIKKRRDSLKLTIREKYMKKKPAYKWVKELDELTKQLNEIGSNVSIQVDYMKLENWTESGYKFWDEKDMVPVASPVIPFDQIPKSTNQKSKQKTKPVEEYNICLAWREKVGSSKPVQVQKVEEFFGDLCLKRVDFETNKIGGDVAEYILKYEYPGTEDAFRLLKMCTQFVLDAFAQSDYDNFNIAIYGKKKMTGSN